MHTSNMCSGRCKLNERNIVKRHKTKNVSNFTNLKLHETNNNVLRFNIYVCMFPLFITSSMPVKLGNNSSGSSQSNGTKHNNSGTSQINGTIHNNSSTSQINGTIHNNSGTSQINGTIHNNSGTSQSNATTHSRSGTSQSNGTKYNNSGTSQSKVPHITIVVPHNEIVIFLSFIGKSD